MAKQQQQQAPKPPAKAVLAIQQMGARKLQGGDFEVHVRVVGTRKDQPIVGENIQFMLGNLPVGGQPVSTGADGLAETLIQGVTGNNRLIRARHVQDNVSVQIVATFPEEKKYFLGARVKPLRTGNKISLVISTVEGIRGDLGSEKPKPMSLDFFDSADEEKGIIETGSDGSAVKIINLAPNEKRKISISIPGFQEKSFSRTFSYSGEGGLL